MSIAKKNSREKLDLSQDNTSVEEVVVSVPDSHQSRQGGKKKNTTRETFLCYLSGALFLVAVLLAVLLGIYYVRAEDRKQKVCRSLDCIVTASEFSQYMDQSVDPCQDFSQYACGRFYREAIIPDDANSVTPFRTITDKNTQLFRLLLEENVQPQDPEYVKKMKTFYASCMDEGQIEKTGLNYYLNGTESKEWPTLNPGWDVSQYNLNDVIVHYESLLTKVLIRYSIYNNLTDSSKMMLVISQPNTGLPLVQLFQGRNDSAVVAYQQYYVDLAVALGADKATALADAKAQLDLEIQLAKISVSREEDLILSRTDNPVSLEDLSKNYSFFDWHRIMQEPFNAVNITLPPDQVAFFKHPPFFDKLKDVLDKTDLRALLNLYSFRYAQRVLPETTRQMRDISLKYLKVKKGVAEEDPRWKFCVTRVNWYYVQGLSKFFVSRAFSEDAKDYMETMILNLKTAFHGMLHEADWISAETKETAFTKFNRMTQKIGYPDENFTDDDMNKLYENYTVRPMDFTWNFMETQRQIGLGGLVKLLQPFDPDVWTFPPSAVNAYYLVVSNSINFPAGVLQPTAFSDNYPSSINYGAIGMIIGHEITHGFDSIGSNYDERGNLRNWWKPQDRQEFDKKSQCLVDQYSNYEVKEISTNVNGKVTLSENIADNGGLKEAYRAYKAFSSSSNSEELPLPGLGLTLDQQFFMGFARLFCWKQNEAALKHQVFARPHAPANFRIIGSLQNNEDFSLAFNCPLGSPMNPRNKCGVW